MITFRLHRKGVILIALGAVLIGFLLFAAGYLTARRSAGTLPAPSHPVVQKKPEAEKKESAAKPHIEDEAFALRVGAFADEAEVKAYVQELAARGHQTVVVPMAVENGIVLHTVLIGRYASRDEASSAAAEMKRKEGISSAVVPAARAGG